MACSIDGAIWLLWTVSDIRQSILLHQLLTQRRLCQSFHRCNLICRGDFVNNLILLLHWRIWFFKTSRIGFCIYCFILSLFLDLLEVGGFRVPHHGVDFTGWLWFKLRFWELIVEVCWLFPMFLFFSIYANGFVRQLVRWMLGPVPWSLWVLRLSGRIIWKCQSVRAAVVVMWVLVIRGPRSVSLMTHSLLMGFIQSGRWATRSISRRTHMSYFLATSRSFSWTLIWCKLLRRLLFPWLLSFSSIFTLLNRFLHVYLAFIILNLLCFSGFHF